MTEKPDFVIAGAAKCGTTALYTYLARHPSVFMPDLKEPGFFSADMPGGISSLEKYLALFAAAPARCLTGEGSTRYLYSRVAIARLMVHNPHAKVIILLRNPVDAAYSLHGYAYRYGHESIADFARAWRAQGIRLGYERVPCGHGEPSITEYDYRATYRYAGQVRRVMERVPPRQRLFLIYEEFFADPVRHYAAVLDFLGLAAVASPRFEPVNTYVGVRSARLEALLRRPPIFVRALYAPLRRVAKAVRFRPLELITRVNRVQREKAALGAAFRRELEDYFADDVRQLESMVGRNLWRGSEPAELASAQRWRAGPRSM